MRTWSQRLAGLHRPRALPLATLLLMGAVEPAWPSGVTAAVVPYRPGAFERTPRARLLSSIDRVLGREAGHLPTALRARIRNEVIRSSQEVDLDPLLLLAVMRVESRFEPLSVSSKGAVGLLQLLPSTAAWVARRFGAPRVSFLRLFEPAPNIRLGAWYLAYLRGRYGGVEQSLHAYNRGPAALDALDWTPDELSRGYARRVLTAYERYRSERDGSS